MDYPRNILVGGIPREPRLRFQVISCAQDFTELVGAYMGSDARRLAEEYAALAEETESLKALLELREFQLAELQEKQREEWDE